MRPTVMLFPEPNSTEETTLFIKPYVGVTTDGKPTENLFLLKNGSFYCTYKNAVIAFLESLNADQKVTCTFPIESEEWRRWHNIERWKRAGVCLEDLNTKQKTLPLLFKRKLKCQGTKEGNGYYDNGSLFSNFST